MFADRLNTALKIAGASATDISRYMDCDRSNVSRFTKGQRVPRQGGGAAQRLTGAIFAAAEDNGNTESLCGLIGSFGTAEDIRSRLMLWLYQDEATPKEQSSVPDRAMPYRTFGQRLDSVMKLTHTSNIRLGKLLSIDPSYISRFRNGFRSPKSNLRIMDDMAQTLFNRVYEQGLEKQLGALTNSRAEAEAGKESLYPVFYHWLYGKEKDDIPAIENLVENIGCFKSGEDYASVFDDDIVKKHADDRPVYLGVDGLRNVVMRFLNYVCATKPPEVYLYSDQNMKWMVGQPEYARQWASLMMRCMGNGTRVNIIHNIERGFNEMSSAIESWLPLYPSGIIRSYYCRRKSDERFSTTLFICPGRACVSGHNVKGAEDKCGVYRYDTDPELIEASMGSFRALLNESGVLVRAYPTTQIERSFMTADAGITVISSKLSLATIPEHLLTAMLDRSNADGQIKHELIEMWKRQKDYYSRVLDKEFVHECIPIAGDELPYADLPGILLRYTREEYTEHLRSLAELLSHDSYRLYPLPQPCFDNIRVRIARDETVITRFTLPHVTYVFEHPYMCGSFVSYGKKIKETYYREKPAVRDMLEDTIKTVGGGS